MPASWEDIDRSSLLRGGLLAAFIYIVLYFLPLGPSFSVLGPAELQGDLHFLLGMRLFNVVLFGLTAALTYVLSVDLFGDERLGLLAASLVLVSPLANHAIIAWTHVPVAFFVLVAFLSYRRFLGSDDARWLIAVAASVGLVFTMKYPDVVILLPILAHMGILLVRDRRYSIIRKSFFPLAVLILILLPTLAFHYSSFGSAFTTPYHMRPHALPPNDKPNIAVTFDPARLVQTIPSMLFFFNDEMDMLDDDVEDFDYREYKSALFQSSPPLVLGLFGWVMAWRRRDNRDFTALTASGAATLFLLYGSWIYFSGGWTTNMRYLTPTIPFLAVFGAYALVQATPREMEWDRLVRTGGAAAVATFLPLSVYAVMTKPLAARAIMNIVSFAALLLLIGTFVLRLWRGESAFRRVFYVVFGAALGVSAVMVFVLDNLLLFNGPARSMLLLNVNQSLLLGLILAGMMALGLSEAAAFIGERYGVPERFSKSV